MLNSKKILAIIPCRSGSSEVKDKNITIVFGKHLIYYTIKFAQSCGFIDKIILSTDSKKYSKISQYYNLKVPFLRPKSISKKNSLDVDFAKHTVLKLKKLENFSPDIIIILRPTSPLRKIKVLKKGLKLLINNKNLDSVRSVSRLKKSPYKSWSIDKQGKLRPIIKNNTKFLEPHNAPRQKLKNFFFQNAVYDLFKTKNLKKNIISGNNIMALKTDDYLDIDSLEDLKSVYKYKKEFNSFKKYINS